MTNRFDEFGGSLFYLNRKRRWNYGISVEQIPYVSRGYHTGIASTPQGDVYVENEFRVLWPDGSVRWLETRAALLAADGGAPRRLVGITRDVTARRHRQEANDLLSRDGRGAPAFSNPSG